MTLSEITGRSESVDFRGRSFVFFARVHDEEVGP
jgi:hypothetical protein